MSEIPWRDIQSVANWIIEKRQGLRDGNAEFKKHDTEFLDMESQIECIAAFRSMEMKLLSKVKPQLINIKDTLPKINTLINDPPTLQTTGKTLKKWHTDISAECKKIALCFTEFQTFVKQVCTEAEQLDFFHFSPSAAFFWCSSSFKDEVSLDAFYSALITVYAEEFKSDENKNRTFMAYSLPVLKGVIAKVGAKREVITVESFQEFLAGTMVELAVKKKYPLESILREQLKMEAQLQRLNSSPDKPETKTEPRSPGQLSMLRHTSEPETKGLEPYRTPRTEESGVSADEEKRIKEEEKATEYYENAKTFINHENWAEAFRHLVMYKEHIDAGKASSKLPSEDKHLYYLSMAFHEANKEGKMSQNRPVAASAPTNPYPELYKKWIHKYPPTYTIKDQPDYITRVLRKGSSLSRDGASSAY